MEGAGWGGSGITNVGLLQSGAGALRAGFPASGFSMTKSVE